jgi:PAS domain-containing protein
MPKPQSTEAVIELDVAGHYVDANAAALELLGVSLAELRVAAPDRFAINPTADADREVLRAKWASDSERPLVGTAGLRRGDGTTIRVGYAIEAADPGFRARLWEVEGSPDAPASAYNVDDVLREWRAAERELSELTPDTPEWTRAMGEIDMLRGMYQELFRAAEPE